MPSKRLIPRTAVSVAVTRECARGPLIRPRSRAATTALAIPAWTAACARTAPLAVPAWTACARTDWARFADASKATDAATNTKLRGRRDTMAAPPKRRERDTDRIVALRHVLKRGPGRRSLKGPPDRPLALTCHAAVRGRGALRREVARIRPPLVNLHKTGRHEVKAVKEPGDLGLRAQRLRRGNPLVVAPLRLRLARVDLDGRVRDRQVAAGWHGIHEASHCSPRVLGVLDQVQDPEQHDSDRPLEVEGARGACEDLLRIAQIRLQVVDGAGGRACEQRPCMGEHDRVVVDVDDARIRGRRLRHLVGVVRGGNPCADVEELADARFPGEKPHHAGQEGAVRADAHPQAWRRLEDTLRGLPVCGEIVLAAKPVVIDPGRVRHSRVEFGWQRTLLAASGDVLTCHGPTCPQRAMSVPPDLRNADNYAGPARQQLD